jgi:6-O-methylguanine DNA methyltransferase, DNA binding domain
MAMSAIEKFRKPMDAKVVHPLPERVAHWGPPGASMLISTPQEVDAIVGRVPKGKLATINSLREVLAKQHKPTITCPITTGIFMNIVAKAAAEMEEMGAKRVTPYWRVLKSDGALNEKYPGGTAAQKKRLEAEGFKIVKKGKNALVVEDFEKQLAKI